MPMVLYTTKDGWQQVRLVPKDTSTRDYGKGVLIGPPDLLELEALGLSEKEIKQINNGLASAGVVDYDSLRGNRSVLTHVIAEVVGKQNLSAIRRYIVHIYEREWFPEQFGGGF